MNGGVAALLAFLTAALAVAAVVTFRRNRALRRRPGDVSVLARTGWDGRWVPGHGVWANDVFAFRRSPAGWSESLLWVAYASARPATDEERAFLRRLGARPVVVTFVLACGGSVTFAARAEDRVLLLGPHAEPAQDALAAALN